MKLITEVKEELYKQNPWWENSFKENSFKRNYLDKVIENLKNKEILFITGLRRIGKTTLMKQIIKYLLTQTSSENILFITLDSFILNPYSIHEIIREYRKIHKKSTKDFFYLFLDEVTAKEDFEQELKNIYDTENIKIICSSSIASFMRDKKAYLTGRTKTIEMLPFEFKEFLEFKNIKIKKSDSHLLEAYFKKYLEIGGIPQYVITEDKEYLKELIQSIIYKDIIAQYSIKNEKVIIELFRLLCERVGKPISYNKLARILSISVDSVKRYIYYFEKTYLFYTIEKHTKTLNERSTSLKKVYIGDIGIKNIATEFKDLGVNYENLVFLKIKNSEPSYYLKNNTEIDFITKDTLIEAKYNSQLNKKQQEIFSSKKIKNKIVAQGYSFFI